MNSSAESQPCRTRMTLLVGPSISSQAPAAVAEAAPDRGVVEDVGRSEGEYGTTVERRGWDNKFVTQRLERALLIWTRPSHSHTGPRLFRRIRGRTDVRPDLRCHAFRRSFTGASTDVTMPSIVWAPAMRLRRTLKAEVRRFILRSLISGRGSAGPGMQARRRTPVERWGTRHAEV